MTETIKYGLIGKEDIRFGDGTFTVIMADGKEVTLNKVNIVSLLNAVYSTTNFMDVVGPIKISDSNGELIHAFGAKS